MTIDDLLTDHDALGARVRAARFLAGLHAIIAEAVRSADPCLMTLALDVLSLEAAEAQRLAHELQPGRPSIRGSPEGNR